MRFKPAYVYILTNNANRVLYVGSTPDLSRRLFEHRHKLRPGSFTDKYNVTKLVYYEEYQNSSEALAREYQIKGGSRKKKIDMINQSNPSWKDLADEVLVL